MQSQGSTSTQPGYDSTSSSESFPLSDSEQAEDDTDVFLTDSSSSVITGGARGATAKRTAQSNRRKFQWTCGSLTDREEEEETCRSGEASKAACNGAVEIKTVKQISKSKGDLLFAQKCAELQGFVGPLLELLNGLKKGRFDHGLTSFQQSVAMDRIQRIVGVLQRPDCGEKYLNTLLQVEVMLKLWFPQISTKLAQAIPGTTTSLAHSLQEGYGFTPPHKHKDQLHIPVKKRRLSWTDTDSPTPSPILNKSPCVSAKEKGVRDNHDEDLAPPSPGSDTNQYSPDMVSVSDGKRKEREKVEPIKLLNYKAGHSSEPSLTWVHVTPILSPRKSCLAHESTTSTGNIHVTRNRGSPATQDSFISSTTPSNPHSDLKKPVLCQNLSLPENQSSSSSHQGEQQAPLKPLAEVCPAIVET